MGYVPVRDPSTGKIVNMVRDGLFTSDDAPAELQAAPAPAAAPAGPAPRPRRRSQLDDQLSGQNQRAQWGGLVAVGVCAMLLFLAWPTIVAQLAGAPRSVEVAPTVAAGQAMPAAAQATLPAAMVAYDRPGGAPLGALEPGRSYRVLGRSGQAWLWVDVGTPGAPNPVWVAAFDAQIATAIQDFATPTPQPAATPVPYVAPAYAPLPDPAYVAPAPVPQATCKAVVLDGSPIGQACGTSAEQLQATAAALLSTPRGAVLVQVATATPFDASQVPTARP